MPLRFAKPSTYHFAAEAKPVSSSNGGCNKMRDGAGLRHGLVQQLDALRNQGVGRHRVAQHGQVHLHAHQVLPQAVVKFAGEFPAFLVLQLQQAHAEGAQGRLGLLPRSQLGVQQAIVEEKQRQGHDERSAQDVRGNAEQPSDCARRVSRSCCSWSCIFCSSVSAWADTSRISCRSRACSCASADPLRFNWTDRLSRSNLWLVRLFSCLQQLRLLGIVSQQAFDQPPFSRNFGRRRLIVLEKVAVAGIDILGACPPGPGTDVVQIGQRGLDVAGVSDPALRDAQPGHGGVSRHRAYHQQNYRRAKCQLGLRPF